MMRTDRKVWAQTFGSGGGAVTATMVYRNVETLVAWYAAARGMPTESAEAFGELAAIVASVAITMAGTFLSGYLPANSSGGRAEP